MIWRGTQIFTAVNTSASTTVKRSATVIVSRRESLFCAPQYREVSTDAPILIPIHKKVNSVMNCVAKEEALNAVSPKVPSMMVSTRLTPVVITLCMAMGKAIFTNFL